MKNTDDVTTVAAAAPDVTAAAAVDVVVVNPGVKKKVKSTAAVCRTPAAVSVAAGVNGAGSGVKQTPAGAAASGGGSGASGGAAKNRRMSRNQRDFHFQKKWINSQQRAEDEDSDQENIIQRMHMQKFK